MFSEPVGLSTRSSDNGFHKQRKSYAATVGEANTKRVGSDQRVPLTGSYRTREDYDADVYCSHGFE